MSGGYCNRAALAAAWQIHEVRPTLDLSLAERAVLMAIAAHTPLKGEDPTAWLAYNTIAREATVSRSTAIRAVMRLRDAGLLSFTEHTSGCNLYRLKTDGWCQGDTSVSVELVSQGHQGGVSVTPGVVSQGHQVVSGWNQGGVRVTPEEVPEEGPEEEPRKKDRQQAPEERGGQVTSSRRFTGPGKHPAPLTVPTAPPAPRSAPPPKSPATPADLPTATPAQRLAKHYFEAHGSPRDQREAALHSWPQWFECPLGGHTEQDITAALTWAVGHEFWSDRLARFKGDWAEWVTQDNIIEPLMRQWRKSLVKPAAQKPAAPSRPKPDWFEGDWA